MVMGPDLTVMTLQTPIPFRSRRSYVKEPSLLKAVSAMSRSTTTDDVLEYILSYACHIRRIYVAVLQMRP
jgi:hypothetical protein